MYRNEGAGWEGTEHFGFHVLGGHPQMNKDSSPAPRASSEEQTYRQYA